ncbi:MAG: PAS domain S-box protein [Tepidisphaeraceae bacterium]
MNAPNSSLSAAPIHDPERLAELIARSPSFMAVLSGPDHVFELANDRYYDIVGHRPLIGKSLREAMPEIEGQGFIELLDRVRDTGEPYVGRNVPVLLQRAAGARAEHCLVDFVYQPTRDEQGNVSGILVHGIDLTEHHRAEQALRESEERFRAAFENAQIGMVIADLGGKVVRANAAFTRLVGRPLDELVGRDSTEYTHPDDRNRNSDLIRSIIAGTLPSATYQKRYFHRDGRIVWAQINLSPLIDPQTGKPSELIGLAEDITDRAAAQKHVRQLLEQQRLAFDAAQLGWWSYDATTDRVTWDERIRAIYGIAESTVTYDQVLAAMHPEDRPRIDQAVERSIDPANPQPYAVEYRIVRPDGGIRWIASRGRAEFDGAGEQRHLVSFVGTAMDVTDQKQREQRLRDSEARFRQLADAMPQIVFSAQPDGHVDYFNRQWYEYTGIPEGEVGYESWKHVHTPEGLARAMEVWPESIRTGKPYEIEYRLRRHDGVFRWHLGRALPVRDAQGRIVRWYGTNTDIHDQKAVEEELRHSREQKELVVRGANVGVWYCPLPFDRLVWDATVKEHFHLAPDDEVTIETFYERLHPDDRERTREAIEKSVQRRESYDIDYRTVSVDGQRMKWIRAVGRAYYDAAGQPMRFDGITMDISERKAAEQRLRENEERYRLATNATNNAIWDWGLATDAVVWNEAAGTLFGHHHVETSGRWWADQIHPEDRDRVLRGVQAVIDDPKQQRWQDEYRFRRGDGTYADVFDHGAVLRDSTGRGVRMIGAMQDLSERKESERERERLLSSERAARSEAERISRMKDEFLATLSHELRTPMSAILGWSQMLRRGLAQGTSKPESLKQGLETVERNARAQTQIIEDLLDMSRIISGKVSIDLRRVDLVSVVRNAVDTVRPAATTKEIDVSISTPSEPAIVQGDPNRLQQVFWNLLSNALKFTGQGGSVRVKIDRRGSQWYVDVIDSGEGIAADFLPHVFERFRQADASTTRRHGGLGLGLAIVRQLIELHGGHVTVHSEGKGHGTTFSVQLPAVNEAVQPDASSGTPSDPGVEAVATISLNATPEWDADIVCKLRGVKVLIVDDEPDARALLRQVLEHCEADVFTAKNAAEAIELLRTHRPAVLVSDIGMPDEDGYTLLRKIRALPPEHGGRTPAVALTAYARADDRVRAIRAGFQMHVPKPVEPAELLTMVATLVREG